MATITVSSLLSKASTILQDPTNIRWPQTELLDWLNDAQREIALFKPNVFVKNSSVQLTGGTKQSLPSDGINLVDVVRNLGGDGLTPGNSIRVVSREVLDAQIPDWHSTAKANATVKHYVYTGTDPKNFYVYPAQPSTGRGYVEVIYVASPTDATINSTITLDDIYVTALLDYILFRAYSKDAEYAANSEAAKMYYQQFTAILTGKVNAEEASNPNTARAPWNPNVKQGANA